MPYHTGEKKKPMNKKPTKKPTKKPLRKLTANELKALDNIFKLLGDKKEDE